MSNRGLPWKQISLALTQHWNTLRIENTDAPHGNRLHSSLGHARDDDDDDDDDDIRLAHWICGLRAPCWYKVWTSPILVTELCWLCYCWHTLQTESSWARLSKLKPSLPNCQKTSATSQQDSRRRYSNAWSTYSWIYRKFFSPICMYGGLVVLYFSCFRLLKILCVCHYLHRFSFWNFNFW